MLFAPTTYAYGALVLAQVAISVNIIVTKHLLAYTPMFPLLALRFALGGLFLAGIIKVSQTPFTDPQHPQKKMAPWDWAWACLLGVFGGFLFNLFFLGGLQKTTASAASIISCTLPAITALCASWFLRESLPLHKLFAIILATLGILLINWGHFEHGTFTHNYGGDFLILLAMLPEAWYCILNRKITCRVTPLGAAFLANISAGLCCILPCFFVEMPKHHYGLFEGILITLSALASATFYWGWAWGLRFIPVSTAALFGSITPISTCLLAAFFLQEHLHWYHAVAIVTVCFSLLIGTGWRSKWKAKIETLT